jgi:hypothetical protein
MSGGPETTHAKWRPSIALYADCGILWAWLDPTKQNKDEHHDQDRTQRAGRKIAPAGAVGPSGDGADEHQDEKDDDDCSKRHGISLSSLAGVRAKNRSLNLGLQMVLGIKVKSGDGDQRPLARMIDRLDSGNAMGNVGMVARHIRDQLRFGAGRTSDQHRLCIGDHLRDLLEELVIRGRIATADRVGLVLDVARRIVRLGDYAIDLFPVEMEDLCFSMINPDNRVIMAVHGCARTGIWRRLQGGSGAPTSASCREIDHWIMIYKNNRR